MWVCARAARNKDKSRAGRRTVEDTKSGTAIIHLGTEAPSHFSTVYC